MVKKIIWEWAKIRTLSPRDMCIALDLTSIINPRDKRLLEIGVFQGAFMNTFLLNSHPWSAIGIDPYPGHPETRDYFFESASKLGLDEKIILFDNFDLLDSSEPALFGLIHIDGEHSETGVTNDLERSIKYLSPEGILVIDDIFHTAFPGISSAVYKFIHSNSISPFLISGDKMWLCFPNNFEKYSEITRNILNDRCIDFNIHYKDFYDQSNSIAGYPQIIVKLEPRYYEKFRKRNKLPLNNYEKKMKAYEVLNFILPGILLFLAKKIYKSINLSQTKRV
jgi:hypothetical protein